MPRKVREAAPKQAAPTKPAPAWRREAGGAYRSADDRFEIDAEGSGRWFVRDHEVRDELGQPRTIGPFPTLDGAKGAVEEARARAPEESPLARRLAEARTRPRRHRGGARRAGASGRARPPAPAPRPKTWLERLADDDPGAAGQARAAITALEALGIPSDEAEGVVRRERDVFLKAR